MCVCIFVYMFDIVLRIMTHQDGVFMSEMSGKLKLRVRNKDKTFYLIVFNIKPRFLMFGTLLLG